MDMDHFPLPQGYEWTDGSPSDYLNWAEGQPNSQDEREACGSADATTLKLSDSVCLTHLPFICEVPIGKCGVVILCLGGE